MELESDIAALPVWEHLPPRRPAFPPGTIGSLGNRARGGRGG